MSSEKKVMTRIFIHPNFHSSESEMLLLSENISTMKILLQTAGDLLTPSVKSPKRIFLQSGNEIKHLEEIQNNDNLYISSGENYYRSNSNTDKVSVAILGSGGVGKSALTLRFVRDFFIQTWEATIEDAYRKIIRVDNDVTLVEVLDTAGQEDFSSLRSQWMTDKDAFIFVYSLIDKESVEILYGYIDLLEQVCFDKGIPPIFFVGTKCDLLIPNEITIDQISSISNDFSKLTENIIDVEEKKTIEIQLEVQYEVNRAINVCREECLRIKKMRSSGSFYSDRNDEDSIVSSDILNFNEDNRYFDQPSSNRNSSNIIDNNISNSSKMRAALQRSSDMSTNAPSVSSSASTIASPNRESRKFSNANSVNSHTSENTNISNLIDNSVHNISTSSKTGENVNELFDRLVREVRLKRETNIRKSKKSKSKWRRFCNIL